MNRTETLGTVDGALLIAAAVLEAMLVLIAAAVALLLTLARWKPRSRAQQPLQPAPVPHDPPAPAVPYLPLLPHLEACTVAQLRAEARRLGLPRSITRTGRKADLVPAIAGAAMAC